MEFSSVNPVSMFINAGVVGKIVMLLLLGASIWTWVLIVEGVMAVIKIGKAVKSAREGGPVDVLGPVEAAGRDAAGIEIDGESLVERRSRIADHMAMVAKEFLADAQGGLPNLAVISSVAPFVGLFGTVWGIMTSFAGIAQSQDTSLAVVAPGIAEALAATAYGLFAAIPASYGYNRIGATFARLGQQITHYIETEALGHTGAHPASHHRKEAA